MTGSVVTLPGELVSCASTLREAESGPFELQVNGCPEALLVIVPRLLGGGFAPITPCPVHRLLPPLGHTASAGSMGESRESYASETLAVFTS